MRRPEAGQFARTTRTWNAASHLDPETFRETFTHDLVDKPATVARLRQAAAGAAQAQTIGEMVDASRPLTQAIRDIGAHRWDSVREGLADKAAAAMPAQFAAPVGDDRPYGWDGANRDGRRRCVSGAWSGEFWWGAIPCFRQWRHRAGGRYSHLQGIPARR